MRRLAMPGLSPTAAACLLCAGAYLLGAVPFGLLLGLLRGVDIRKVGSGNIGATNLSRALGRPWGIAAFTLDFVKGLVPVVAARRVPPEAFAWSAEGWLAIAAGLAAVLGHVFPVYLRFRGGKGVATTFGVMAALAWLPTAIGGIVWGLAFLATRTVSVASLAAAAALPVAVGLLERRPAGGVDVPLLGVAAAISLLVAIRHRANIGRLLRGEELRFGARPK
jgi:glycerol-3-phosphate acyltransferase PlsY